MKTDTVMPHAQDDFLQRNYDECVSTHNFTKSEARVLESFKSYLYEIELSLEARFRKHAEPAPERSPNLVRETE